MNELSPWRIRRLAGSENIEPDYIPGSQQDEVSLSFYWNILLKRRKFILAVFFAVFAVGAYFALSSTTYYTAATMIKIEPQNPQVMGVGELQPLELRGEYDYHKTQFELLRGRPLAAKVISQLGLESNKAFTDATIVSPNPISRINSAINRTVRPLVSSLTAFFRSKRQPEVSSDVTTNASDKLPLELSVPSGLIQQYLQMLQIAPLPATRLVSVQFLSPDPVLSQALANAHAQTFMQLSLESRFGLTKEARDFLDQKKADLRSRLETSEAALNKFRRAHGVVSVEKGENIVVDRLVEVNKQLTAARAQRIEAESLYRTVENRNNQDLAEVMRQGLVQQLKSSVATLEAEKARSGTIFKPDHPRIQELNQQIAAARQALAHEIANIVGGIKSGYAAALAKEQGLQGEADRQQRDALRLKELGVDYTLLQEEVNANRSLYESVLKRLSETNVFNGLGISNMEIAERAAIPLGPSGPNVPMYLIASILSGLFLGIGGAFIREMLGSAVGTPEDVWRSVGLGTLGVVPHVKFLDAKRSLSARVKRILSLPEPKPAAAKAKPPREVIINHSPHSILKEAYRSIRTSLLLSQAEKAPQVILLTSPSPGEGKTVSSVNLAIALAQDGYSVLLMDADMRKGCCHERLGLSRNSGLSNILTGRLSPQEGIRQTPIERLSLMSRGAPPPNPSELLGSRIMKETLKDLREIYDFILIDSPPVIGISDAAILSVLVDGVLLVLDGQNTSTPSAQKAVERLDMVRARLLGVILNAVNLQDPHYSYFRSYNQYYTYRPAGEENGSDANGNGPSHVSNAYGNGNGDIRHNGAAHAPGAGKSISGSKIVLNGGDFEAIPTEDLSNLSQAEAVVSQPTLSRVVEALTQSIGPLAPKIVQEHIASLGESRYAFPENRINDLLQSLKAAITDDQLRLFSRYLSNNHPARFKG
jgi:polysaccharide biosynthesis transport protein